MTRCLSLLILIGFVLLLPTRAFAQPVLLAGAMNKSAFVGDATATFQVVATGATSYQWQIGSSGSFSNLTENGTFSGTTTDSLTISNPTLVMNGTNFRCKIFNGSGNVNSAQGTLNVYPTPSVTPAVTVTGTGVDGSSNPTIAANSTASITINITGLNAHDVVRVQRILDSNGDHVVEPTEPVTESFVVTDGQTASIGGVADPDLPGDDEGTANGNITTHINLSTTPEGGRLGGNYIIKVTSPSGEFAPITKTLVVTQPNFGQSVSGQVTAQDGTTPIPYASVILLASNGQDQNFVCGTNADANGNYTLQAPVGNFDAIGFAPGYVQSFSNAAQISLASAQTITGANLSLTPATCNVISKIVDSLNSNAALRGVQLFMQSNNNGQVCIAHSDSDGNLLAALTSASDWDIEVSQYSTHLLGYLQPQNDPTVDTTGGGVIKPGNLTLTAANALIYGTVKDGQGNGLAGVTMQDSDNNNLQDDAVTYGNGSYFLLANGPSGGSTDNWNVNPSDDNPTLNNYIPISGQNVEVQSGQSYPINLVAPAVTAHFTGTATKNGVPLAGITIDAFLANNSNSNINIQTTTDGSGNFDLGVDAGTWNISLDSDSADSNLWVGPQLTETVADNQTISGIAYQVLASTSNITGTVKDYSGNPVSNSNVNASASIDCVNYFASANTDNSGNYSLPVINGTWTIQANANGLFYNSQNAVISGPAMVNFTASVITNQPTAQVATAGQGATFNVGTNAPGSANIQWQVSTDSGSTWANLTDNTTYSGSTNNSLNLSNISTDLNGYQYRCVVFFTFNSNPLSQTSTAAPLTVNVVNQPPGFSSSPSNQQALTGGGATFSVATTGFPTPTIQWQDSTDGGNTWSNLTDSSGNISGSTSTTLTLTSLPLTASGYQYRAVASNSSGSPSTSTSVSLQVGISSNYLNWLNSNFSPSQLGNPAMIGLTATPADDGIANLLKYAFGLPPLINDIHRLPFAMAHSGTLSLSVSTAESDVTFTIQVSTDLVHWSTTGVNIVTNSGMQTGTYTIPSQGPVFLRVVVTPNSGF